jgi:5-methylcytosine-specific restriction endonuclease McrA
MERLNMAPTVPGNAKQRRAKRELLFERQAGICHWCGQPMLLTRDRVPGPQSATFEHLQPRSKGGKSWADNVVLAHLTCNARRADATGSP